MVYRLTEEQVKALGMAEREANRIWEGRMKIGMYMEITI